MKYLAVALMYLGFFGLIALAVYWSGTAWALLALTFTPSWKSRSRKSKKKKK